MYFEGLNSHLIHQTLQYWTNNDNFLLMHVLYGSLFALKKLYMLLNRILRPGEHYKYSHFTLVDRNQVLSTASKCQKKKKQEQET